MQNVLVNSGYSVGHLLGKEFNAIYALEVSIFVMAKYCLTLES